MDFNNTLIGMVHIGALPGTPRNVTTVEMLAIQALEEARHLEEAGFDAIIIENMHDAPYVHGDKLGPEIVAAMTRIALEIEAKVHVPLGIQILSGGNRHALAVAQSIGAKFIRCENFVYSHVADEGLLAEAEAGPLLRYRKSIGAGDVKVCCDIKKKHASQALTSDISIAEAAESAEFFGADALIVTGTHTGKPTDLDDVRSVKKVSTLPVIVGSGTTVDTVAETLRVADAAIIGSAIKRGGVWHNPVDPGRAAELVAASRG